MDLSTGLGEGVSWGSRRVVKPPIGPWEGFKTVVQKGLQRGYEEWFGAPLWPLPFT
jgi:hypothetical protein